MIASARVATWAAISLACTVPRIVTAQASGARLTPEFRGDAIVAEHRTALQAGGGVQIPAGYYVRIGMLGAAGADVVPHATEASGRFDLVGRFLLDPFRQSEWGLSIGAGLSLRVHAGDHVRPYLLTLLDLEGPRNSAGLAPSVQLGLGGGARIGAGLRWVPKLTR